ncbi:hypothetical protein ACQKNX_07535 [Lysinibacillus sp. NPDC093712]|uniref:hypothetical protein n=1 Tax=Lysinibacillus sp. NPDC093712 TaxID=3390579 RepID=UPI003D06EB0F
MGVDASYLYGYGAEVSEIEWDIDYLKEKYKDKPDTFIDKERTYRGNWGDFISSLEEAIKANEAVSEVLEDLDGLLKIKYDDENYLTFDHTHIAKLYPDTKLKDLDDVAKQYAKELGIKNVEVIKWIEWGYFS